MATEGVEGVYLETHNWGKTAGFLKALGYEVEFTSEGGSSMVRNAAGGPYLIVAEVPEHRTPQVQLLLKVADADAFKADVDVVTEFEETHYGTREMTVRDPDGRIWSLQAPLKD
ncbi:VOC family protein [Pseudonocardia acaciae]|uniref:VOC family protein n=1 Tax=Pseudonocardia acaciae TaxID=551276 RepID=UPI00049219E9|nr:glyoxalase/bleomycin resistance/dioxygenase family protein [Pseudonocardia acaciae]